MSTLRLPCYAKVNLSLVIKGKREDGFHEIESLVQQIDLHDTLTLTARPAGIRFTCDHAEVPGDEGNLCVRAAQLLVRHTGCPQGVDLLLNKRIPHGAGLGGGSSDAAVTLMGLNRLWNLGLSDAALAELASRLGSDVPFFLRGGLAVMRGRGERLRFFQFILNKPILVVFPGQPVSTAWAYSRVNLSLTKREKSINFASFNSKNFNDVEFYSRLANDFEAPVFESLPLLEGIKNELARCNPLYVGMSGSGSSLFGVFRGKEEAVHARRALGRRYQTFLCKPIRWGYPQVCPGTG